MSENNQQAVVDETNTQAQPGSEVQDARNQGDDLDKLLAEFETSSPPSPAAVPPPQKAVAQQPDVAALHAEVEALKGRTAAAEQVKFRQDMNDTIKSVRGDLDPDIFDDAFVEAWIDGQARKDPRLSQAWLDRDANPAKFGKIKQELGRQLASRAKKLPDRAATEDRAAVAAAVRGSSSRAPDSPPPNFANLSNQDFEAEKAKMFGE